MPVVSTHRTFIVARSSTTLARDDGRLERQRARRARRRRRHDGSHGERRAPNHQHHAKRQRPEEISSTDDEVDEDAQRTRRARRHRRARRRAHARLLKRRRLSRPRLSFSHHSRRSRGKSVFPRAHDDRAGVSALDDGAREERFAGRRSARGAEPRVMAELSNTNARGPHDTQSAGTAQHPGRRMTMSPGTSSRASISLARPSRTVSRARPPFSEARDSRGTRPRVRRGTRTR